MATLALDLRQRIVSAYDQGEGTRDEIVQRFRVSLGMVKGVIGLVGALLRLPRGKKRFRLSFMEFAPGTLRLAACFTLL